MGGGRDQAGDEPTASGSALRRDLGLVDAVGVGLGAIIGAGIFVVTGVAAGVAGPAFLVGLILAGVAATLFGTLEWIVAAATFTILLYYSITSLAALQMEAADRRYPNWISALGLLFCLVPSASLNLATVVGGLGLLAVGFAVRWLSLRLTASVRRGGS